MTPGRRDSIFRRATCVDVLRFHGITPPSKPGAFFTCPLPGHNDRSPSFHLTRDRRAFSCFGCGARGGISDLLIALGTAPDRVSAARWLEACLLDRRP